MTFPITASVRLVTPTPELPGSGIVHEVVGQTVLVQWAGVRAWHKAGDLELITTETGATHG